jgi:sugar phosphate isomerase/epimerase
MDKALTRRGFIALTGIAGLAGLRGLAAARRWGVQLYTVRDLMRTRPRETLAEIARIGYQEVEVLSRSLEQIAPILRDLGLSAPAGHFEAPLVTGNWGIWKPLLGDPEPGYDWEAAVEQARRHRLHYMVIAYLLPGERGDLDFYRRFADQMNGAGETCRAAGIHLCYHNHAFEFEPMEGTTPMEVLMDRFDPELVGLELDVFWVSVAGHDPSGFLRKHSGRVPLIHLKDRAPGVSQVHTESVPRTAFREVGSGTLDIIGILKSADDAGVRHFIVEQDHCPGNPLDSLRRSYGYLAGLGEGRRS